MFTRKRRNKRQADRIKVIQWILKVPDEKTSATNYGCRLLASIAPVGENTNVKLRRYILVKQLTYQALKVPSGSVLKTGGANAWKIGAGLRPGHPWRK